MGRYFDWLNYKRSLFKAKLTSDFTEVERTIVTMILARKIAAWCLTWLANMRFMKLIMAYKNRMMIKIRENDWWNLVNDRHEKTYRSNLLSKLK